VPNGHDQTFHLVINNYGQSGTAFAETDIGEADLETVISDLMSGSTATRFASSRLTPLNVGLRMPRRMLRGKLCAVSISPGMSLPSSTRAFVDSHLGLDRQLTLRLN